MISMLMNYLWQSTLCALAVTVTTLLLRKDGAHIRYWLGQAASLKFLIPFSILVTAGGHFSWHPAPIVSPQPAAIAMEFVAQPFPMATSASFVPIQTVSGLNLVPIALTVWVCGFVAILAVWLVRWSQMAALVRMATVLPLTAAIAVKSTPSLLEPGVIGIFRPVLLLPDGIANHLTPDEMNAIVTHELCHVRRWDNLTAALHMLVQALFWFHPLVWWLGTRLVEERERACDEAVVKSGSAPETYAEAILKVCKFYVQSPLACAAGVSGADLKKRIAAIMTNRAATSLNLAKKLLLATVSLAAIAGPLAVGWTMAPQAHAQTPDTQKAKSDTPSPGTEASLRRYIDSLEKDQPNYAEMSPDMADAVRQQLPTIMQFIKKWGALKSIAFKSVNGQGLDSYDVTFEHGQAEWMIAPLSPEGKVTLRGFRDEWPAEQEKPRAAIKIDPKLLDKYVGHFLMKGMLPFEITRAGDQLFAGVSGQQSVPIYPESNDKFFYKAVAAQISFNMDAQDGVTAFVLHQNGNEWRATRIDEATAKVKAIPAALAQRIKNNTASPGTEAALRRQVEGMTAGQPPYANMEPALAEATRAQFPYTKRLFDQWGPLKSVTFTGVGPGGADIYNVAFEHGQSEWRITPLSADGKISGMGMRPLP